MNVVALTGEIDLLTIAAARTAVEHASSIKALPVPTARQARPRC